MLAFIHSIESFWLFKIKIKLVFVSENGILLYLMQMLLKLWVNCNAMFYVTFSEKK